VPDRRRNDRNFRELESGFTHRREHRAADDVFPFAFGIQVGRRARIRGRTGRGNGRAAVSLEFAGYAALIADDPTLARPWFDRDTEPTAKKRVRDEFHGGRIKAALTKLDPQVSAAYSELYERLIQFGAHPNEKSITANLTIEKGAGETKLNQVYLQGDGIALDHWLRTASQLGICTLKIFERIHHARFAELKVSSRFAEMAQGL
jgi:hypothetical protein